MICNYPCSCVDPLAMYMYMYMYSVGTYESIYKECYYPLQERAFLGVSTLKELVLKRPQGPDSTESFLQALLEVTMGHIELVGNTYIHLQY